MSHVVVLQDGGALLPKAITKHIFFFKTVTLIVFVIYYLIKVEITLLNNVNLTDCFTSTLSLRGNVTLSKTLPAVCRNLSDFTSA